MRHWRGRCVAGQARHACGSHRRVSGHVSCGPKQGSNNWLARSCPSCAGGSQKLGQHSGLSNWARSIPILLPPSTFDGAFSNFGGLNCLADRRPVARGLAGIVRPGGTVVLGLMGPFCPWETGWHLLHGKPRQAFRRFRSGADAQLEPGITIPVWYPSSRRLEAEFQPWFAVRRMAGIGSLLPPSYLGHLVDRWPGLFGPLARLDQALGPIWPWTWLNDHYLIVLERC